jgi:VanZ family protein
MHFENNVSTKKKYWYSTAIGKTLIIAGTIILTGIFCEWPDFHPEHFFGANYHWWLDMVFHGGYYLVITIFLYVMLCKGRQIGIFWITILGTSYAFEALQGLVPGRTVSLLDMTSNLLGISIGTVVCSLIYR